MHDDASSFAMEALDRELEAEYISKYRQTTKPSQYPMPLSILSESLRPSFITSPASAPKSHARDAPKSHAHAMPKPHARDNPKSHGPDKALGARNAIVALRKLLYDKPTLSTQDHWDMEEILRNHDTCWFEVLHFALKGVALFTGL